MSEAGSGNTPGAIRDLSSVSFNSVRYSSTEISALGASSALSCAEDQTGEAGVGHFRKAGNG
ncbi:hypothetical protein [Rhizobium sp. WYCCWR 11146]|uniref:hypothetical protein n=1 Tax=Rhizobium sp. WYCCWR 11146 TaxID=2749833 RepID=UPI0015E679FE|nr:hypothetical protein [Rhizobium sp. WYCCWR 11146]MBA1349783.1 hypothetical protein [Rhizobium sp. WYCCWR 11146]